MDLSNMLGLFKNMNNNNDSPNNTLNMLVNMLSKSQGTAESPTQTPPTEEKVSTQSSDYYPYGELPLKYTKNGQEALKQQYMKKPTGFNSQNNSIPNTIQNFNAQYNNLNNPMQYINNNENSSVSTESTNSNNGGLDMGSLMPLLSNLLGNSGDGEAIKKLVPLLNKNGNLDTNDLLKLFAPKQSVKKTDQQPLPENNVKNIDTYKKVY